MTQTWESLCSIKGSIQLTCSNHGQGEKNLKTLQYCMKINRVDSTAKLPSFPQLYPSTGMSEKAWVLKLLGVFESLRGKETKKLGNNFKGT